MKKIPAIDTIIFTAVLIILTLALWGAVAFVVTAVITAMGAPEFIVDGLRWLHRAGYVFFLGVWLMVILENNAK